MKVKFKAKHSCKSRKNQNHVGIYQNLFPLDDEPLLLVVWFYDSTNAQRGIVVETSDTGYQVGEVFDFFDECYNEDYWKKLPSNQVKFKW